MRTGRVRDKLTRFWLGLRAVVLHQYLLLGLIVILPTLNLLEYWQPLPWFNITFKWLLLPALVVLLMIRLFGLKHQIPKEIARISLLFLGYLTISALFVNSYDTSKALISLSKYLLVFLAIVEGYNYAQKHKLETLLYALYLSSLIPLLVGIYQVASGNTLNINNGYRAYGTYPGHPLGLALFLQTVALVLYSHRRMWEGKRKYYTLAYFGLLSVLLFNTYTRLVIATYLLGIMLIDLKRGKYRKLLVITLLAGGYLLLQGDILARILNTSLNDDSTGFRMYIYREAADYFRSSPLIGHGLGSFVDMFYLDNGHQGLDPHNDFLGFLVETGIVGLGLYLGFLFAAFHASLKKCTFKKVVDWGFMVALLIFVTNILGALENPYNFYDVQLFIWALLGAQLAQGSGEAKQEELLPKGSGQGSGEAKREELVPKGLGSGKRRRRKGKEGTAVKICLVGSSGGHLMQLYQLQDWWGKHDRFWVTFKKEDATSLLSDEKTYWCYYPTNRNIKNLIRNTFLAVKILFKEKPDLIISTGAAPAIPFFYLGKLLGSKLIYIEVYDRIDLPTITGKVVYPIADSFIVQWEEQKKFYPKAVNLGGLM